MNSPTHFLVQVSYDNNQVDDLYVSRVKLLSIADLPDVIQDRTLVTTEGFAPDDPDEWGAPPSVDRTDYIIPYKYFPGAISDYIPDILTAMKYQDIEGYTLIGQMLIDTIHDVAPPQLRQYNEFEVNGQIVTISVSPDSWHLYRRLNKQEKEEHERMNGVWDGQAYASTGIEGSITVIDTIM